jgi:predicted DNA binding protein
MLPFVCLRNEGRAQWTVLRSDRTVQALVKTLETKKTSFEVKMKQKLEDTDLLTTRQEQILSIAFERGYFDFPKKQGLEQLAADTGIRASTLAEIIRRGQKKILGEYLSRRSLLHRSASSD